MTYLITKIVKSCDNDRISSVHTGESSGIFHPGRRLAGRSITAEKSMETVSPR